MLSDFLNYIVANNLIKKDQKILAAVSGGIDSMVMAHLFIKAGIKIGIAHCNFCLRGTESDKDEALVKKFSEKNKLPFYSIRFDTQNYAKENGISIQMAARDLRYRWFEDVRKENGYDLVASAHNLNDNVETMLINLTRGTGIAGLTGMKPSAGCIIRPLLFATRKSIEIYCSKNRLRYREDQSNTGTKYTRNKIRHLVIPVFREINPSVEITLNETAGRFREVNEIMDYFITDLSDKLIKHDDKVLNIRIKTLKPFLFNDTIIYELFKPYGITGNTIHDIRSLLSGKTGSSVLTGTHRIIKNRNEILITGLPEDNKCNYIAGNLKELKKAAPLESVTSAEISKEFEIPKDAETACLNFEKIKFPVTIRNWQHGDFFYPLGMKERKKISDYLIDRKYSLPEKEKFLILESDGKIIWLIGERIDDRFKVTPGTKRALIIKARTRQKY